MRRPFRPLARALGASVRGVAYPPTVTGVHAARRARLGARAGRNRSVAESWGGYGAAVGPDGATEAEAGGKGQGLQCRVPRTRVIPQPPLHGPCSRARACPCQWKRRQEARRAWGVGTGRWAGQLLAPCLSQAASLPRVSEAPRAGESPSHLRFGTRQVRLWRHGAELWGPTSGAARVLASQPGLRAGRSVPAALRPARVCAARRHHAVTAARLCDRPVQAAAP